MSDTLHAEGIPDALVLLHYHVGSQVPDIQTISRATREAARFYAKLRKMGHSLGYLDVGGGLGVDYDGSRTSFDSSRNYTLHEYTRDIVYNVMEICDSEQVEHPVIVSESGRFIVAPHSVLVIEAFGSIEKEETEGCRRRSRRPEARRRHDRDPRGTQREAPPREPPRRPADPRPGPVDVRSWSARSPCKGQDRHALLADRGEDRGLAQGTGQIPEEVRELEVALADQLLCNFSVFQSSARSLGSGAALPGHADPPSR